MKDYTEIQRLIAISYNADNKFAINNPDIESAQNAILEANKQHIGFEEYLLLHKEHLNSKGCLASSIEEQLQRVKDLASYFTND